MTTKLNEDLSIGALRQHIQRVNKYIENEVNNIQSKQSNLIGNIEVATKNAETQIGDFSIAIAENTNKLVDTSKQIDKDVEQVSNISESVLKIFETHSYRKKNLKLFLNTVTALMEIRRILPLLEEASKSVNIEECQKLLKIYISIKNDLIDEFCQTELDKIEKIKFGLESKVKEEFQKAVKTNQTTRMNDCHNVLKLLSSKSNTTIDIMDIYSKQLEESLQQVKLEWTNYLSKHDRFTQVQRENYQMLFFNSFIKILENLVDCFEGLKDGLLSGMQIDEIIRIIQNLIDGVGHKFVGDLLSSFTSFFNTSTTTEKPNKELVQEYLMFCEETSLISNQHEEFINHLSDHILSILKNDKIDVYTLKNKLYQMTISKRIQEIVTKFFLLQAQFNEIIGNSILYTRFKNFDKNFFSRFSEVGKELKNKTELYEFIDEIFFLVKTSLLRTVSTRDKTTVIGLVQYISETLLGDDVYSILNELFLLHLRKENYNFHTICLSKNTTIFNTFICILFHCVEIVIDFLKKLKVTVIHELKNQTEHEDQEYQMVSNLVSEMEQNNLRKYKNLLQTKLKVLTDGLKIYLKSELEIIEDFEFVTNEKTLNDYENVSLFSTKIKNKINEGLAQWKNQLSREAYDIFLLCFAETLGKAFEGSIAVNKFNLYGALLIDREIRYIITFYQTLSHENVKKPFQRVSLICEILMLDSRNDVEEFIKIHEGELDANFARKIALLRVDLT